MYSSLPQTLKEQFFKDHLQKVSVSKSSISKLYELSKRSEGTKEQPSETTTPTQNHRTVLYKSKTSKATLKDHHDFRKTENWFTVHKIHKRRVLQDHHNFSKMQNRHRWVKRYYRTTIQDYLNLSKPSKKIASQDHVPQLEMLSTLGSQSIKLCFHDHVIWSTQRRVASTTICPSLKLYTKLASKTTVVSSSRWRETKVVCDWVVGYYLRSLCVGMV